MYGMLTENDISVGRARDSSRGRGVCGGEKVLSHFLPLGGRGKIKSCSLLVRENYAPEKIVSD